MARRRADQAQIGTEGSPRPVPRIHQGCGSRGDGASERYRLQAGGRAAGPPSARPARGLQGEPILWKTVKKGLSAGRVQTVALRLLVERERDIRAFKPQEYWSIAAAMEKDGQKFTARLHAVDEKKVEIHDETRAKAIVSDVERLARATARAA